MKKEGKSQAKSESKKESHNPGFGDKVEITTEERTYTGMLLKRPDLLEGDFTVIKLDSGYNIGIDKKRITEMRILEKKEEREDHKAVPKKDSALPTVSIISTGGTISSKIDYHTGGVYADYTADDFVAMIPELKDIANIRTKKAMMVMSEDHSPVEWLEMARSAAEELNKKEVEGVVITIGTDTMHYASAALSFYLKNLNKPVILTGAQRSIDRGSSDAFMNLACAITAASKFDGAIVGICMHGTSDDSYCLLSRGTRVRKMHTSRRDAFRPINELPLAKVYGDGTIEKIQGHYPKKDKNLSVEVEGNVEKKVAIIHIYPGMEKDIVDYYLDKGYKGIVLNATALGHVPTLSEEHSIMKGIERAAKEKIPVVIASQTIYGAVHPLVYTNLRKLSLGNSCIFVNDMLTEVAYVKLGWALGKTKDVEKIKELMVKPIAGEISATSDSTTFLI